MAITSYANWLLLSQLPVSIPVVQETCLNSSESLLCPSLWRGSGSFNKSQVTTGKPTSFISRGWANRRSLSAFSMKFLPQNPFLLLDVHPLPLSYHHRTCEFLFLPPWTLRHSGIQTLGRFSLPITIALTCQCISFPTLICFVESPRVFLLLQSLLATLKLSSFWKYSFLILQCYKAIKTNVLDIIYITNTIWVYSF